MPLININKIQHTLLAISTLDKSSAEYSKIHRKWEQNFHPTNAVWVDVSSGAETNDVLKQIGQAFADNNIQTNNQTIIVSIFLDLTKDFDGEVSKLLAVPGALQNVYNCHTPLNLEFGFVSEYQFLDKSEIKGRVKELFTANSAFCHTRLQFCLVATPPTGSGVDLSWEAVITLLDILRRNNSPAYLVPNLTSEKTNDNICFIRYGEYCPEKIASLEAERAALWYSLGEREADDFRNKLAERLLALQDKINNNYQFDERLIPIPAQLNIRSFFEIKKAEKGRNTDVIKALQAMQSAVFSTAKKLERSIIAANNLSEEEGSAELDALVDSSKIGLLLEKDSDKMLKLLSVDLGNRPIYPALTLAWRRDGNYSEPLQSYLNSFRELAIYEVKSAFLENLRKAYSSRADRLYEEKYESRQNRLAIVDAELKKLMSKTDFIKTLTDNSPLPSTGFYPIVPGGTSFTACLCLDNNLAESVNHPNIHNSFCINPNNGGLISSPNAALKAIQFLVFNIDEQRLNDLLK